MPIFKSRPRPVLHDTTLGASTELEGTLRFTGSLRMRGSFSGRIEDSGDLRVDRGARCTVDSMQVSSLEVAGTVSGPIRCSGPVRAEPTAELQGTVHAASLRLMHGCRIECACTIGDPGTAD